MKMINKKVLKYMEQAYNFIVSLLKMSVEKKTKKENK